MKIATDRFGEIEFKQGELLHLPEGIIGFPGFVRALLLDHRKDSPFRWLQSADDPKLAFVVIDPLLMVADYPLDKLCDALARFGQRPNNVAVAAIATVPTAPLPITVNLAAPLAFDAQTRRGAQIILDNPEFHTKHMIVREDPPPPAETEPPQPADSQVP